MVDFYKRKTMAYDLIGRLLLEHKSIKEIELVVAEQFGFARIFVLKYINTLVEAGHLKLLNNGGDYELIKK